MSFKKYIIAFFVISILGTIGHFLYDLSSNNFIVGLFFPVNESLWEHLKLLFFPTVIYSAFEYFLSKEKPKNYIFAILLSTLCGLLAIVVGHYTLSGIIGRSYGVIDISLYYISVIIMLIKKRKLITNGNFGSKYSNIIFLGIAVIIAMLFMIWSYNPPSLAIFNPPIPE